MAWVRLDDEFYDHPKIVRLSDAAFRAHIVALGWANRYLTDGLVPAQKLPAADTTLELIAAGVWEVADDGIAIHDYLHYQPSSDEVLAGRAERSDAKRRAGQARASQARRGPDGAFRPSTQPAGTQQRASAGPADHQQAIQQTHQQPTSTASSTATSSQPAPYPYPYPTDQTLASPSRRDRGRDELFEVVAEVCGITDYTRLTKAARGALNRAVGDLRSIGATPGEVRQRAANWPYDSATLTPSALAKHYPALVQPRRSFGRGSAALRMAQELAAEGR